MGSNGGGGGVEKGELTPPEAANNNNNNNNNNSNKGNKNSYWMKDMYKYSYPPRGYGGASGLYNIAWAQAVQNKPLNAVLVELDNKKNDKDNKDGDSNKIDDDKDDSEKEEGELEEGEIDGEFENGDDNKDVNNNNSNKSGNKKEEIEDGELEIQVSSIRKVLDNVTAVEANKSFDIVCARLRSSLESLKELVLHTWFPSKDDLIQQSFSAFLCVYSVFSDMNPTVRDQNRDKMSRLLTFVMSLSSILFTSDQRKEVEAMIASVNPPPPPSPPKPKSMDRQEELPINNDKAIITDSITASVINGDSCSDFSERVGLDSLIHQSDKQNSNVLGNAMNQFQANLKAKGGGFSLLLDLHKVHDEDSLPSPTSKTAPTLPCFGSGAPPKISHGLHNSAMHPYETQALKAMSSYQQKFGASSFMTPDRLPSPTPSEDGNEEGVDVFNEEVNSFGNSNNVKNAIHPMLTQSSTSSAIASILPATQDLVSGISAGTSNVGINPASRISGKSRDPRLRHLSSNSGSIDLSFCPSPLLPGSAPKLELLGEKINPKKKPEGPVVDSPALKRHKSGLETTHMSTNVNEVQTVRGSIGSYASSFLGPATDPRKSVGITVNPRISSISTSGPIGTISQPVNNGSYKDPLQSLLNGLSGNPAALVNILKEQQKINEPLPKVSNSANSNSVQVSLPTTSSTMSYGVGPLQTPSLIAVTSPQEDPAKHRMKPRDPRRVLQSNVTQKTGNNKVNGLPNVNNQGVKDNFNTNSTSSFSTQDLPDIAMQFTKNLKNIADIITSCEMSSVLTRPSIGSQTVAVDLDKASVNSDESVRTVDHHSGSALKPAEVVAGRPPSQNHWGDVEHLFEGYDTQERAAIQQERARRMGEQKQMFDSRKLCLVLDLDHTLLNSAKFVEVDPRHDEILRKKEEHDREKPQRHLFRFPRMGMWTKLRPGVWNFLEKASKLYELHLYTMGNKLYATEMAKLLDPNGSLFAGRVISRGDDGESSDGDDRVLKTKDLDGVLGMESSVVIIDDSVRVWPHNKLNLIVVERYLYFPCSRRQFGLSGPSLLDCDRDERPEDGTLACCLGVIERLHKNFFANKSLDDVDVRNILASEQRSILAGCRILFSRVFPVGESNPHLYPLWQTAEQFGAVCTNQIDEQVTHVVANAPRTDKVNWALSTGRFVVHPSWVEASAVLYRRAREHDFAIKP